ncbi:neuropeptide FF receptor 1-like [Actinia tenebrosa]|uniref:Neuropeptide FF receptor 1-like n=1 Tax=Actinia tenebrosa TaxID=6105 RepID=A0A6P8HHF7_ACTTE|nr:neuropeptide FF receptor 1-like [Actinia tenebrosa]
MPHMEEEMANDSSSSFDSNSSIFSNSNQNYSNSNDLEWRDLEWRLGIDITIFVVAVIGNFAVLVVIYTTRERRKTPFEILIANLSVADVLSVLLYFKYLIYFNIPRPKWYCKLVVPFFSSTQMVSVLTMTTIAIFPCRSIVHPFKTKPSTKLTYSTVAGLWLVANICLIPDYLVREQYQGRCKEIWPSELLNKVYTVSLFVVQYMIPLTIIAISYTKIILYLKRNKVPQCGLTSDRIKQLKMTRKRDMEVIKISLIIVLLYTISTLPIHMAWILLIVFESNHMSSLIFKFSPQLLLLHSCCNPFVYGTISREYRSRFVQVLWSILCCVCKIRRTQTGVLQTEQGQMNNACEDLEMIEIKGYVKRDKAATEPATDRPTEERTNKATI